MVLPFKREQVRMASVVGAVGPHLHPGRRGSLRRGGWEGWKGVLDAFVVRITSASTAMQSSKLQIVDDFWKKS
jgi:hypothetical protein